MKLNLQCFFFNFVILCATFNLAAAIPRSVLAPEIRGQIEDCDRDCHTYRVSLKNFLISMTMEDWAIAKKDFSTCQWRCHRCTLQDAILGMLSIENEPDFLGNSVNLAFQQNIIIPAISECLQRWELSAIFGCDRNPVESYTTDCVLY